MENNENNSFYKGKYFDELDKRFKTLEEKLDSLDKKIDNLTEKVVWIYAFAGGVGAVSAVVFSFVKDKIL